MPPPIAVQLYTLREQAGADPAAVLQRLGAKGFVGVESAGLYGLAPGAFAELLANAGLELASAHVGIDDRAGDWTARWAADLDAHRAAGATTVVIPALLPDRFANRESIALAAELVNTAAGLARDRDLTLAYHNHFWELRELDGQPALLHFFAEVDPAVAAEIDIYWAQVGGVDPTALVRDLRPRVRLLHVKDGPADRPESDMVAVGDGAVRVREVLEAGVDVEWHIVELDRCATDMFEAVERSFDHLVGEELSWGRR